MPTAWLYLMPALCNSLAIIRGIKATAYTQQDYPNPQKNPAACGMDAPGYICDPAHILSQQQVWSLNTQLAMVSNATTFECDVTEANMTSLRGYRISVAVIPRIRFTNGHYPVTAEDQLHALTLFAEYLHDIAWPFGRCGDHGVIILSSYSHKIHTVLGDRLATALPPSCAKVIMDGTHDLLVAEHFAAALERVLTKYRAILLGEKCKYGWSHWYTAAIIVATGVTMVILYCAAMACNNSAQSADKRNGEKLEGANGSPLNGVSDPSQKDSSVVLVATEDNLSLRRHSFNQDADQDDPRRHVNVKRSVSSVGDYGKRHVSRHHRALNIDKHGSSPNSASNSTPNVYPNKRNVGRSSSSASTYGKRRAAARRESTFSFVTDFRYKDGTKASSLSLERLDQLERLSRENSKNSRRRNSLEGKIERKEPLQRTLSAKARPSPAVRASPLLLV